MAKKTGKKSASSRSGTASRSRSAASARKKPAARKTTRKKVRSTGSRTSTKKKVARRRPAAASARKKTTTRKTSKKKVTKKKTTKKPVRKKTAKKPVRKKTAKRPVRKKPAARKKTTKKPAAKKKTVKKPVAKKTAAKKTAAKKTTTKKTTSKKKTSSRGRGGDLRRTGRSVAQAASIADADEKGYVFINGRRVRMITTSGKIPPKRSRAAAQAETPVDETPKSRKPVKTHLTRKQLNHYRNLLLIKRAELVGDLSSLEAEALRSSGGNLSHMPIHMADIGSDTYEQDFMLGLAETERTLLREIDAALQRIEDGTYGICQMTLEPIPDARLEAKPWATYTIEAARQIERGWTA